MNRRNNLIGESPAFLNVLEKVSILAKAERPVLIVGERGSGKELIASRLHFLSTRWDKPYVTMNCAAMSKELVDSELFGHEAGSFTGARSQHSGKFERAEKGTLFLDEIATAPLHVQEKLLRVVEYGEYERVGGSKTLYSDVRLISATNEDLTELIKQNRFREDLLDRLTFDVIHVPPLRYRKEDIMLLAQHFAIKMCKEINRSFFAGFSKTVEQELLDYNWPGNVRQLRNVVERAVFLNSDPNQPVTTIVLEPLKSPFVSAQDKPDEANKPLYTLPMNLKDWLESTEQQILSQTLASNNLNQKDTAHQLGLSYHQLRGLVRKYGIPTKNS
ncbi:phage shock protein operon transcriptional activator [Vibrio viridaestus]|uniref:Phage shock protein operon transcriptional activator n=1 Tax=Vibrio viridaestus TaxID=2487322 RepID=A0A3N9THQ6_9VIBR|nr:phage shock protein operon transcriptional activator [Vibrio viridaestus]RQW63424.1 phage shock protein operon transcriptional activator [Vibrio viridaestus]